MIAKTRKEAITQNQKRYHTGVPCIHGHIADRRASTGECIKCRAVNLAAWRKAHPEKIKQHNDTQYAKHSEALAERSRKFYSENAKILRIKKQEYQRKNLHIYAKINAKRRAAKLQRTPKWLGPDDWFMIKEVYELAALRTKMLGFPWEVDHIIPLQGDKVSGLHVPHNLQVIPRKLNRAKWNLYEVT